MCNKKNWYLLRCKPRSDDHATSSLEEQGYPTFSPIIRAKKSKRQAKKISFEPLFPGYIFIRLDPKLANWRAIRSTRCVIDIVKFGEYFPVVHESVINAIIEQVEYMNADSQEFDTFSRGDIVEAPGSCFDGLKMIYQCSSGRDRVRVLIDAVGRMNEVSLNRADIQRCSNQ